LGVQCVEPPATFIKIPRVILLCLPALAEDILAIAETNYLKLGWA